MKLTIEHHALLAAMTRITGIASKSHAIDVCRHVMIEATMGEVTFRGSNLDMQVQTIVAAEVATPGACLVLADTLMNIAKNAAPGAEISLDLDERLSVKSGKSRFNLATLPVEHFPVFTSLDEPVSFEAPARHLRDLLVKPYFAVGHNAAWFALTGVYLFGQDGHIGSVATDQKRLTLYEYEAEVPDFGVIIPAPMVDQSIKLLDGEHPAELSISKAKISLLYGRTVLTSKIIDGEYPAFRRVVPDQWGSSLTIAREALAAAVRRASIASDDSSQSVRMVVAPGRIDVTARGQQDSSDAADECECIYDGEEISLGMNGAHMLDALAAIEGETAELSFSSGPVMFRKPGDEDFRAIVMPLKG